MDILKPIKINPLSVCWFLLQNEYISAVWLVLYNLQGLINRNRLSVGIANGGVNKCAVKEKVTQ